MLHKYHLFERFRLEIELMIVDKDTYAPLPVAHNLLTSSEGQVMPDLHLSDVAFSNEMIEHHIEVRTSEPVTSFTQLHQRFHRGLQRFSDLLNNLNAILLPGAMHPFLDPTQSVELWHEQQAEIFEKYDEIFNVRRHGCANIQSCRLLLPYYDDAEFSRLHNLIRLILPMIPALAAGSPIYESKVHSCADCRLKFYNTFHEKFPEIAADIIPETVFGVDYYENKFLQPIRQAVHCEDTKDVLPAEWLNARGVVPRFEKQFLEIRLIDTQESMFANCAVALLILETIKYIYQNQEIYENIVQFPTAILKQIYLDSVEQGENIVIRNHNYLLFFNIHAAQLSGKEFWQALIERTQISNQYPEYEPFFRLYQREGSLSSRLLKKFDLSKGETISQVKLKKICKELARCLQTNDLLQP